MNPRAAERVHIAVACALGLAGVSGVGFCVWQKLRPNAESRREVTLVFRQLPLGATSHQVQQQFTKGRYRTLNLRASDPTLWLIRTPTQFGAKNWFLYLDFKGNRLIAKRIRVADSVYMKPREPAPQDEIATNAKLAF